MKKKLTLEELKAREAVAWKAYKDARAARERAEEAEKKKA